MSHASHFHTNKPFVGPVPPAADPLFTPEVVAHDPVLKALLNGMLTATGKDCYRLIVKGLAQVLGVRYAAIAEFLPETASAKSVVYWDGVQFLDPITWPVQGTPCQGVTGGQFSHFPSGLSAAFPKDHALVEMHAESYVGAPLHAPSGAVLGHIYAMDTRPMPQTPELFALVRIFAARAVAEMVRSRLEHDLAHSEEQFRDLFDEAPIAYVFEGMDSRLLRVNKAAMRSLGLRPDQVEGTYGKSFAPDTPDAQRRMREAFDAIGRETDTKGVILEMRRKDNGLPLWIEWWSSPARSGNYTRTMFIDITERVLMEQEKTRLAAQNTYLREEIKASHNFGDIVGSSPSLLTMLEKVERVAPTDSTVLIQGETGTGKELIARAIHERSQRRNAPFVKVNCAALPAGLVESEFFGHEKGSFTGAVASRRGRFELADGGTIFLDEVGEVSPDVQVKLLRVLQESEFERVGGTETVKVNVRVIAATNRDLAADLRSEKFRADLFYRLSVFPIKVPPLRDRVNDIPMLAACFITQLAETIGKRFDQIDPSTIERLMRYAWPGNIRELRNVLERAAILCDGPVLRVSEMDLRSLDTRAGDTPGPGSLTLEDAERRHIEAVLKQTGGIIAGAAGAAKLLGLPPSTLRSTMARLGIKAG